MRTSPDQLSIETPELVPIEMQVAGIGSRFVALLVDMFIWLFVAALLTLTSWILRPAIHAFSKVSAQWQTAIYVSTLFLLNWGYFTLFEAFGGGRTPGKRLVGIRVIQCSGRAIGLFESMARNLLRYVDQIPFCYAVAAIAVFATRQHQRLGDLVAGTLVVRDRPQEVPLWAGDDLPHQSFAQTSPLSPFSSQADAHDFPPAALSRLSAVDLQVLENFFARRLDLPPATRQSLALRIAAGIQTKTGLGPPANLPPEFFLEKVAFHFREQARLRSEIPATNVPHTPRR